MLYSASKVKAASGEAVEASKSRKRVPVRLPAKLIADMSLYHSPKEKSDWVEAAIKDLFERQIFKDANWQNAQNEDTAAFMSLLHFDEVLIDPANDTFLLSESVLNQINIVTKQVAWLQEPSSRSPKPALIRAAIRQRILLKGKLLSNIF